MSIMFTKKTKKDSIRLKFDTSSDNLACFIRKNAKTVKVTGEIDVNDRLVRAAKRKGKSVKSKTIHFQNQAFLQSILANTFTEEFAGSEEIKELVNNLKFSEKDQLSPDSKDKSLTNKRYSESHPAELLGSFEDYHIIISECLDSPKAREGVSSTRVGTEETPENSDQHQFSLTSSFNEEQLILPYEYSQYYDLNTDYYNYRNHQLNTVQQRRRKHSPIEEAGTFTINLHNIEIDNRTTLMIRNIPNKYTQQLLLEEFNRNFKVKFDFFYLPIDYNNACNVGYAFINFIHAKFIPAFYHEFNGKRWSRFNSEKICSLTYARIQGTGALRSHFKNSHVMQQKDKRFRPLLKELDEGQRNSLTKIVQDQQQKF